MNLIKANIVLVLKKTCSVRIHESILMSSFMRHLQRLVKFWQRRKKYEVDSAPAEWICSVLKIEFRFMLSKKT